ncbi:MAG TPA: response regulator [Polyangia bacterium]|jgi:Response regulator containing CheY-like receiver, AAA-type ATPase, and DNA-binding domains|nr:response regulator [Polyangia bacterium]
MKNSSDPQGIPESKAPKGASETAQRRPRVLVAEDDWALRDMLLLAFENDGWAVVAVGDGAALLDVFSASLLPKSSIKPFDLVVSDIRMPGWGGIAAVEHLSRNPQAPPVVLITAFGSEEIHKEARRAGAVVVLDKPFDMADLTALSRRVISQHAA